MFGCSVPNSLAPIVRQIAEELHGKQESTCPPHAHIPAQRTDVAYPGEELRLGHGPGNSRPGGCRAIYVLRALRCGKGELLLSASDDLRTTLDAALKEERLSTRRHAVVIGFSGAMFEHAHEYRNVYYALLHTQGWPLFRQRLQDTLQELIRRECKNEIQKLRKADSEVPVDLFVHYLTSAFLSVLTWWLDRRSRLAPKQINEVFRSLVLPTIDAVLD